MGEEERIVSDQQALTWLKQQLIKENQRLLDAADPEQIAQLQKDIKALRIEIKKLEQQVNN